MADRKQSYTPARHKAIVKAVRGGMYRSAAAKLLGLHPSTLLRWLREGQDDEGSTYRRLWEDVEQAEAEWEQEHLDNIAAAAASRKHGSWTADAWLLERRMPEKYGRNDRVTVEGGERPIEVATHHLLGNPEQLSALLGNLASLQKAPPAGELIEGELLGVVDEEPENFLKP